MDTYTAERVSEAIDKGIIKKWPWRYYKIYEVDTNKYGGKFQVDCDSQLAEVCCDFNENTRITQITEEEFNALEGKEREFDPCYFPEPTPEEIAEFDRMLEEYNKKCEEYWANYSDDENDEEE